MYATWQMYDNMTYREGGGVAWSYDFGYTWHHGDTTTTKWISNFSAIKLVDTVLICRTGDGIYRSMDNAQTWSKAVDISGSSFRGFAVSRTVIFSRGYLGTYNDDNALVSNDYGLTWDVINEDVDSIVAGIYADNENVVAFGTSHMAISKDKGLSWSFIDNSFLPEYSDAIINEGIYLVFDVSIHQNRLYAACRDNGVKITTID